MRSAAAIAAAAIAAAALMLIALSGPAAASAAPNDTITRSAPVAYGTCLARSVVVGVTMPTKPFDPKEIVEYQVTIRNHSGRTCGPDHGPIARVGDEPGIFGPCGPLPLRIVNTRGVTVYPPPEAISCPGDIGPRLRGHQTLTTGGSWDQIQGGGRPVRVGRLVPRGTYRLTIAGKVSVPLVLSQP
jgi:hypothetical protein